MTFGGNGHWARVGSTGAEDARRQIDMCLDAGMNLIDTANVYSFGQSEEMVGEALEGRRADVLVATKVRFRMGEGVNDAGLSRHHIIKQCEDSLRRLRTDWIDLYQVHQWDGQTPLEETIGALDTLVQQGKVRYIGCSNYSAWHMMKAIGVSHQLGAAKFVSQQIHYSLQARDVEYEVIPSAFDQGVGTLIWSPLGGGLLSGKYRRGAATPEGTRRLAGWSQPPIHDEEQLYDIVESLVTIAGARGVPPAQIALAWLLSRPSVSSVIIGGRTDDHFKANLGAVDIELTAEEKEELNRVSKPRLLYPYWHQASAAKDRLGPADLTLISNHVQL